MSVLSGHWVDMRTMSSMSVVVERTMFKINGCRSSLLAMVSLGLL